MRCDRLSLGGLRWLKLRYKLQILSLPAIICAWTLPILCKTVLPVQGNCLIAIATCSYGARGLRFSLKTRRNVSVRKQHVIREKQRLFSNELLTYGKRSTASSLQ